MTKSYRGHRIEARREKSLGGDSLVYYGLFRETDWYECDSGYADEPVMTVVKRLKKSVDLHLDNNLEWGEF